MSNSPNKMLNAIKKIVNTNVALPISAGELYVSESGIESKVGILCIRRVPQTAFAFTLDYEPTRNKRCFQQLSCYVEGSEEKINKRCDLVLVVPPEPDDENAPCQILILDLKSNRYSLADTDQLRNSELYILYLLSMAKEYEKIITPNVIFKWVIVKTDRRGTQRQSPYPPNNEIPFVRIVDVQRGKRKQARVYLAELLSGRDRIISIEHLGEVMGG